MLLALILLPQQLQIQKQLLLLPTSLLLLPLPPTPSLSSLQLSTSLTIATTTISLLSLQPPYKKQQQQHRIKENKLKYQEEEGYEDADKENCYFQQSFQPFLLVGLKVFIIFINAAIAVTTTTPTSNRIVNDSQPGRQSVSHYYIYRCKVNVNNDDVKWNPHMIDQI